MDSPWLFRGRQTGYVENFVTESAEGFASSVQFETNTPNVVTSRLPSSSPDLSLHGLHAPLVDLDLGAYLEPSSTPGHFHLYLEHVVTFAQYVRLLTVMVEIGLVQEGYLKAVKARGYGTLRLPWVFKDMPIEEQTRRLLA